MAAALVIVPLALVVAGPAPAARADASFDQQLLALMNQSRASAGLPALALSGPVAAVAGSGAYTGCGYSIAGRASDMGGRNYFSHTIADCGGRQVFDMLTAAGVPWSKAAENIAWESGTVDPAAAARTIHDQFMSSPPHRANILDPALTHVGVGSWHTTGGQQWTGGGAPYGNVYVAAVVFATLPASAPPAQPPSAVTGVAAVPANGALNVSWSAAAANGSPLDLYGVYLFGSAGYTGIGVAACASCTTATLTGLANGTPYYAVVFAHNAVGWSGGAATGWVTPGTPLAPAWASAGGGRGSASAAWGPSAPGAGATDLYVVLAYEGGAYTGVYAVACATCTSATVTGLTAGHTYTLAVLAHNGYGWSTARSTGAVTVS